MGLCCSARKLTFDFRLKGKSVSKAPVYFWVQINMFDFNTGLNLKNFFFFKERSKYRLGLRRWLSGKESAYQCRRLVFDQEDPLEEEMATPSVFLLENPMDRGAWQATVHGVTESDMTEHTHTRRYRSHFYHLCLSSEGERDGGDRGSPCSYPDDEVCYAVLNGGTQKAV